MGIGIHFNGLLRCFRKCWFKRESVISTKLTRLQILHIFDFMNFEFRMNELKAYRT